MKVHYKYVGYNQDTQLVTLGNIHTCTMTKTWFQNRRMKEKRQHKDDNKNYYFPSGGVDVSQLVAMGIPCPA
jgi:hypothetical protein